jgi:hypothetical protein
MYLPILPLLRRISSVIRRKRRPPHRLPNAKISRHQMIMRCFMFKTCSHLFNG